MSGQSIMIASGKGGVGKTWLSITLAHGLAKHGARVLLLDADLGLANVDIQLGVFPERDLRAVVGGTHLLSEAVMSHDGGFDILAGRSGAGDLGSLGPAGWNKILALVAEAKAQYDHVVVDLPAGLDPFVRLMSAAADRLLVITTEEPTSLTDAYAVLKMHQRDRPLGRGPGDIVVNQANSQTSGLQIHAVLAGACTNFLHETPALAAVIPHDKLVNKAIRQQSLLMMRHQNSAAGTAVHSLADKFCRRLGGIANNRH